MVVVRCGGSGMGTIVEECVVLIFSGKIKYVYVALPDGLVAVPCARNHEMVRKNWLGIEKYVVFLALASLEADVSLFRETVAEEAGALRD